MRSESSRHNTNPAAPSGRPIRGCPSPMPERGIDGGDLVKVPTPTVHGSAWNNDGMRITGHLAIDDEELAGFCRRHGIVRLALFGSMLTGAFGPGSDVDLLVEFAPGRAPGLLGMSALERELSDLIGGHDVDLRTAGDLSPRFRDRVRDEARELYAAA